MARRKNSPGGMLPETIRTAYLGMFADMTADQQDGVIEALQTIKAVMARGSAFRVVHDESPEDSAPG